MTTPCLTLLSSIGTFHGIRNLSRGSGRRCANAAAQRTRYSGCPSSWRSLSSISAHPPPASTLPFHVGIIGSGPAGFYTAQHLLRNLPNVRVDMYEGLPVPYGLVRFGVAPDHPEVKNVVHKFETLAEDDRFQFVGNVTVGRDLAFSELKPRYDAIVLSYGASEDRHLNIPGETSTINFLSARAFVGWYNGLPEYKDFNPILTNSDTAVVVGQGNVALDVARTLLTPVETIAKTDICAHAVDALRKSTIKHVHLVGRRGPLQVAFTAKELREMIALPDTAFDVDVSLIREHMSKFADLLAKDRQKRRLLELMLKGAASNKPTGAETKSWSVKFLNSPHEVISDPETSSVKGLKVEKNRLETSEGGKVARAVGSGEFEEIPCSLVLRSIGYKSIRIPGMPFDDRAGVITNVKGKVMDQEGLYVAGWLKRGPIGVIAATMYDANETADSIIEDVKKVEKSSNIPSDVEKGFADDLKNMLRERDVQVVDFNGWKKIDEKEVLLGSERGKPREKITDVEEMLAIARS